jgi:hypothetical protein
MALKDSGKVQRFCQKQEKTLPLDEDSDRREKIRYCFAAVHRLK